ncbi:hypothetical protein SmJEL517_g01304 [Synchytrium microbalum]|uniref:Lysosomal dipeptide transporter MFSD1 n=1 Tax=Synchytrium microbalum TaxID=1806994 RepID=A0A507C6H3_9FUNG|nr:uncharacterized protein SmJEL517_g01304 [Synchytrium microbalum]TPX36637.1 hypothetical protein SmJEL517_g01304 [Synchytrium microbalum]
MIAISRHYLCLFFVCILLAGNYYAYDTPSSLNVPLREHLGSDYDTWQWQINLLYSVYSLPNIFLPLIGGFLIDRLGTTTMLLVFSALVCLGQALFAFGVSSKSFAIMLAGRILFGIGGESLEVAQARITTDWFSRHSLAFAFGVNLSSARLFTAANDNLSPWIHAHFSTPAAAWFGVIVAATSFLSGLVVIYLDRDESRREAGVAIQETTGYHKRIVTHSSSVEDDEVFDETTPLRGAGYSNTYDGISIEADDRSESFDEQDETVHCSQIRGFRGQFWLLCLICITLYGASVPFFHICTDFFQQKWLVDGQEAGWLMSIPDIVSSVGSPVAGIMLDHFGHRSTVLPISGLILLITHTLFAFTMVSPMVSMTLMGIAYSVFASGLWPCVPYLVARHQIATAYGFVTMALNMSLFLFPLVVAQIRTIDANWVNVELFFIALSSAAVAVSLLLCILDYRNSGVLTHSSKRIQANLDGDCDTESGIVGGVEDEEVTTTTSTTKVVGEGVFVSIPATSHLPWLVCASSPPSPSLLQWTIIIPSSTSFGNAARPV